MSNIVNHEYHIKRLSTIKDFGLIWQDEYFQKNFVHRYMWNLPLASFELFGAELTHQQIDIWDEFLKGNGWRGARVAVPSGHGTGKDFFIGNLASLHLLTHFQSITRLQAPTLKQITTSSFKEITKSLKAIKSQRKINGINYTSRWSFLFDLIQINKEKIYIKGYETSWYIEAVTAPKGDPTNLAGQHQFSFLLILNEASGIYDDAVTTSLGALSETYNCCLAFSQHTKLSGKFHEFVTQRTVDKGGVWRVVRISSRKSPNVSKEQLKNWIETYSEDEVRVRLDGLPPRKETGKLIDIATAYSMYDNDNDIFNNDEIFNDLVFSFDLGYSGYRDSSVLGIAEAYVFQDSVTDRQHKFLKVKELYEYSGFNGKLPMEFIAVVFNHILNYLQNSDKQYTNIYVIGDATAGGYEPFKKLEDMFLNFGEYDIIFKPLQWGSERLYFEDKKRFVNARAKAFVNLKEHLEMKRVKLYVDVMKNRILNEVTNIKYKFSDTFKFKIMSKEEMKKENIKSPDIADTLAQMFLIDYISEHYDTLDNKLDNPIDDISEEYSELEGFSDEDDEVDNLDEKGIKSSTKSDEIYTIISLDDEF